MPIPAAVSLSQVLSQPGQVDGAVGARGVRRHHFSSLFQGPETSLDVGPEEVADAIGSSAFHFWNDVDQNQPAAAARPQATHGADGGEPTE